MRPLSHRLSLPTMSLPPLPLPFLSPTSGDLSSWPPQSGASSFGDLASIVSSLQQTLDSIARWARVFQRASTDILTRLIWESPGLLPQGADLPDFVAQIELLPGALRSGLETVRAKLMSQMLPGSMEALHEQQIGGNPTIANEATGIAEVDEIVAGADVQQTAASQATALAAAALSEDRGPSTALEQADDIANTLITNAGNLPSSRAGIELLNVGVGLGLHQQAEIGAATADRLTVLVQQTAQVSQQISALAATTGALTLRQAERDRQALNARVGFADAISAIEHVLQDSLNSVGEPAPNDIRLDPLY